MTASTNTRPPCRPCSTWARACGWTTCAGACSRSGELQGLIDDGLRGMTSNPTIFEHAIGGSNDYDDELMALATSPATDREMFERIAVEDVRQAADLFRPVYDATAGADGFVSLEVSPSLARDTEGTIAEARRLWGAVDRPNLMIKVPGHQGGLARGRAAAHRGHQRQHHAAVLAGALPGGGRGPPPGARGPAPGGPADRSAGVGRLVLREPGGHRGRSPASRPRAARCSTSAARSPIANARLAYAWFRDLLASERLAAAGRGGRPAAAAPVGQHRHQGPAPTPTCSTWTRSSAPTRSTPCRPPRSGCSRTTGPCAPRSPTTPATRHARHGAARGRRRGPRRRHPRARGRRDREVRQVVRGAARRDRGPSARRSPPRRRPAIPRCSRSVDASSRAVGSTPWTRRRPPSASGPTIRRCGRTTRHAGDPRSAGLAHGGQGDGPAGQGPHGLRRRGARRVRSRGALRHGRLEPGAGGAVAHLRRGAEAIRRSTCSTAPIRAPCGRPSRGDLAKTLFIISSKSGTTQESDSFFRYFWERTGRPRLAVRRDHRSRHAARAARRRARVPPRVPQSIGHRRPLLGALLLRPGAGGADRRSTSRPCCIARTGWPRPAPPACRPWRIPPPGSAPSWARRALAGRDKATFVLSPGHRELRSLGGAADRREHRQGRQGHPAGGGRAARRAGGLWRRPHLRRDGPGRRRRRGNRGPPRRAGGTPAIRWSISGWMTATTWARSSSAGSSPPPWRAPCSGINPFDQPNVAESKANTKTVLAKRDRAVAGRFGRGAGAVPRLASSRATTSPSWRICRPRRRTTAASPRSDSGCATA